MAKEEEVRKARLEKRRERSQKRRRSDDDERRGGLFRQDWATWSAVGVIYVAGGAHLIYILAEVLRSC